MTRYPDALPLDALVRLDGARRGGSVRGPTRDDAVADALAVMEDDGSLDELLAFTPVPRQRCRRNGWTPDRQRLFILALAACGSVGASARVAGMAVRGVYRLVEAPGAQGFARAWDDAVAMGYARTRGDALGRAVNGALVPVYRKGKLVRVEHRYSDRLAIGLLSGRDRNPPHRWQREDRAQHRADQRECDAVPPAEKWAVLKTVVDRIVATWAAREAKYGDLEGMTG